MYKIFLKLVLKNRKKETTSIFNALLLEKVLVFYDETNESSLVSPDACPAHTSTLHLFRSLTLHFPRLRPFLTHYCPRLPSVGVVIFGCVETGD